MYKVESYHIFDRIYHVYDRLNLILSLGIDRQWRKRLVANIPADSGRILDLATGTGDVALAIRSKFHKAEVTGIDPSVNMLDLARQKATKRNASIAFIQGDGADLSNIESSTIDAITIAFGIRNISSPQKCLQECHRVLRAGGTLAILEFGLPRLFPLKVAYLFYFRHVLPRLGGLISGDPEAYRYLNSSVESFPYAEKFDRLMIDASFHRCLHQRLSGGIAYIYRGVK